MDKILGLIINANSLQTLVLLVAIISGYIHLNSKIDKKFAEQDKRIDDKFAEQDKRIDAKFAEQDAKTDAKFETFYQKLKTNDFAHIHDAINSLTFLIRRGGIIDEQDETFVRRQLEK